MPPCSLPGTRGLRGQGRCSPSLAFPITCACGRGYPKSLCTGIWALKSSRSAFPCPFGCFFSLLAVFVTHPSLPQPWSWMLPPQHCTSTELAVLFPSWAGFGWTDGESKQREQHLKTPKCSGNSVPSAPGGSQLPVRHLAPRAATFGVRKPNVLQRVPAGAGTPSAHKTLSDISLWLSHGE